LFVEFSGEITWGGAVWKKGEVDEAYPENEGSRFFFVPGRS
jgi:hypothetical protein